MVEASRSCGWHCQVGQQEPLDLGGEPLRRPNERLGRLTFRLAKFSPSEEQPYSMLFIPGLVACLWPSAPLLAPLLHSR